MVARALPLKPPAAAEFRSPSCDLAGRFAVAHYHARGPILAARQVGGKDRDIAERLPSGHSVWVFEQSLLAWEPTSPPHIWSQ